MNVQCSHKFEKKQSRTRVYVDTDLVTDSMSRRQAIVVMRLLAKEALVLKGAVIPNTHLTFSQTAGCPCGCSPGFLADGLVQIDGEFVADMWVTVRQQGPGRAEFEAKQEVEFEAALKAYESP